MLFVPHPPGLRVSSRVNPRSFSFDVEPLLVNFALNTVKPMPAYPRNNLTYLGKVVDVTGL